MEIKRVVTIARSGVLQTFERKLGAIYIHSVTVSKINECGRHSTFFANDRTIEHSKNEILPMSRCRGAHPGDHGHRTRGRAAT